MWVNRIVESTVYRFLVPSFSVLLFLVVAYIIFSFLKNEIKDVRNVRFLLFFLIVLTFLGFGIRFFAQYFTYHPNYMYSAIANTIHETGLYGFCTTGFSYCVPVYKPYTIYVSLVGFIYNALQGVSFAAARNLNVFIGSLSVVLGFFVSKKYSERKFTPYVFVTLLAFFPLHIELSKSMETHAFSVFFALAFFGFLHEFRETREYNFFGFTVLMYVASVLSKPMNVFLIFPLVYVFLEEKGTDNILKAFRNRTVLVSLLTGVFFVPLYYLLFFVQGVAHDTGLVFFQENQVLELMLSNGIYIFLSILCVSGLIYGLWKKDFKKVGLFLVYYVPLLFHTQLKPVRLILPAVIISMYLGSELIGYFFERVGNSRVLPVLFFVSVLALFFISTFRPTPYNYFSSEEALSEELEELEGDYVIWSRRADLAYSVSTVTVRNTNYEQQRRMR